MVRRQIRWRLLPALGILVAGVMATGAAEPGPRPAVDFARDIHPVLQRSCFECHGPDKQRGQLRLDTGAAMLKGGENGPAVVPGQPERSELLRRITLSKGSDGAMPARGEPLTQDQIALVRAWIAQGAKWPATPLSAQHWAYVKPTRPALPEVKDTTWPRNAVDHFILARLEQEGLRPSPEADRATLIRRLALDLIGLPPAPAEVDAFLADPSADAYERLVDRLLASPHFGERWARPWLDLARYADSHGFQRDDLRSLWPYRDWVLRALNADMPFDQFTIEQLAGDLLPHATREQKIATGFHRCAPINVEAGSEPEESRVNQVFDRVSTTAAIWLGTTLECAQCHDHKYDPFTQKEYYQLFAFFNNTAIEADRSDANVPGSIRFLGPSLALEPATANPERERLTAELARLDLGLRVRRQANRRLTSRPAPDEGLVRLQAQRTQVEQALQKLRPLSTLVMQELPEARPTAVLVRGNYREPGEPVGCGTPAVLSPLKPTPHATRLDLARWLVDPENPLPARVTVNRWWAELFGRGIVGTDEDFGIKGEPPTHPELLDWLAVAFRDDGWSMKRLLRTLVLSATYRQSSRLTPELRERDDQNRLYARMPRLRLDAEMIRDNALTAADLLSRKQFGPPIRPYQPEGLWNKIGGERIEYVVSPGADRHRRGLYVVWKRSAPYPSFVSFDATARLACTVRRSRSNTPLQALTLLNDPVYVEAAVALARRIIAEEPGATTDERIRYAFRLCLSRPPNDTEQNALRRLFESVRQTSGSNGGDPPDQFVGFPVPQDVPLEEFAAWYAVATALLNLDETITKG